jgi:hypothetical protein
MENKTMMALQVLVGIPKGAVSTEFRKELRRVLQLKYPDRLSSSALQDVFDGKCGPRPVEHVAQSSRARLGYALTLMNALETMREESLVKT